jgi:hypothetical protein
MKLRWVGLSLLSLSLVCFAPSKAKAMGAASPAVGAQYDHDHDRDRDRDHDWDAPPSEFRDAQRQGFHDGIEGARKDFENHRPPNVGNRDEFRHPHVARDLREDYREGFRAGYDRAMSHLNSLHY